jgi:hypothetical protein
LAISIADYIESITGKGMKTTLLLDEYCELAYQASQESKAPNDIKKLRKHLIKTINTAREELKPDKLEVAFFPYQASMFDSLESVYLAAREDPQCDAYVVPIPYYEVMPDNTRGPMHYDGDKYPADIPVTDWREYDIEARHPDVIFIHYAYDDIGNNARVHPDFYSKRLREHCEQLIYIPYFVTTSETVDEHNGYLPGILNAHRVIVATEKTRQDYIRHYTKYDKLGGWHGKYGKAEDKFVALGSPKFDKVLSTKREDYDLPEECEGKKIVLYNTHMFALLIGGEKYLEKMRSVFEFFRNRDDAILWWRPHPNTELNLRLKNPVLYDKYMELLAEFKKDCIKVMQ